MSSKQQRKTSGSYYTPLSLVDCLLDTTLDPLIEAAEQTPAPEKALRELTICDPSCGAGVFLIRAAHRVADHLATHRAGGGDPARPVVEQARRDVAANQMYGVDLNPAAVDITRLALAAEAAMDGKPNPFLGHRIKHGNALIGATPALMAKGIPDGAFKPIEGDDPKYVAELRKRNRLEREALQDHTGNEGADGQLDLFGQEVA